jgi:NAD(P)-dependent dehydrogenase (short-subunit alcohol dehydrogenase family)
MSQRCFSGSVFESNSGQFVDEVIVISGASRGLGRATAEAFANHGGTVVVNYRTNREAAAETVARVEEASSPATGRAVQADMTDPDDIDDLFEEVEREFDAVDVFVHNAAVTRFKPLSEVTMKDISLTFGLSVNGFILATQRAIDLMDSGGRIISVSGAMSYMPYNGLLDSAKSAMEQLTRYFAIEHADDNINANAIRPGVLAKEDNYFTELDDETREFIEFLVEKTPKKRAGELDEVAAVVLMLASDEAEWITGEVIDVNGGLSAYMAYH